MNYRGTVAALLLVVIYACGAASEGSETAAVAVDPTEGSEQPTSRQSPPESGPRRDVAFPAVEHRTAGAMPLHIAAWRQLPIVYYRLIIKSGSARDPVNQPGLAHLVGQMLQEGTRNRTSKELADEVDFLGASLWVDADDDTITIGMRSLAEHTDQALDILSDVALNPRFVPTELQKLKARERNQLVLREQDPNYLASREFYKELYGAHPYSRIDITTETLNRVQRRDLVRWHRTHFVAQNAELVVVGDVDSNALAQKASSAFARFPNRSLREAVYADAPTRDERSVLIVNRPDSVQSVIVIGNLALARQSDDFIKLEVANQVLGGSAASRLFMDLRERRSLTYGAYSRVGERVSVAPFYARAAVRTAVTAEAVGAFFEHLNQITTESVPSDELESAHRFLSDSFPLQIDTPGKIASLIGDLRTFGLGDDYWDAYRSNIFAVSAEDALAAAQRYILPDKALVVVVGKAADFATDLRRYGPVTVVDASGEVQQELPAADEDSSAGDDSRPGGESASVSGASAATSAVAAE